MKMKFVISLALVLIFTLPAFAGEGDEVGALERAYMKAADKVAESVVAIEMDRKAPAVKKQPTRRKRRLPKIVTGSTAFRTRPDAPVSGVLIKGGYVLTSNYNVTGNVSNIKVTLHNGRCYDAKLLGRDEVHDLGLLKIETEDELPELDLPDENEPESGQFVVVVGRSENALRHSMTKGIVSAVDRLKGSLIQIDALLNYGNTGGAVVDIKGVLLGTASGITHKEQHGVNSGTGFFTPLKAIKEVLDKLKAGEVIKRPKMPYLGVQANSGAARAVIAMVMPNTAAEKAGFKAGDVILEFNGEKIEKWLELRKAIGKLKPGEAFTCKVERAADDGSAEEVELDGEMGERPYGR